MISLRQKTRLSRLNRLRRCITAEWLRRSLTRPIPESNRITRLCRPLRSRPAHRPGTA